MRARLSRLWRDTSLRSKLILSYVVVLAVPLLLLSMYEVTTSRRMMRENVSSIISGMVSRSQEGFTRKAEQLEAIVSFCAYENGLQRVYRNHYRDYYDLYGGLSGYMSPILNSIMATHAGDADELLVYSSTGLQKYGAYLRSADSVAGEAWYQEAARHSGIRWWLRDGGLYVTCRLDPISRVYGREPMGLVYLRVKWPAFLSQYIEIDWPHYRLTICDADGALLYQGVHGDVDTMGRTLSYTSTWQPQGWQLRYEVPVASLVSQQGTLAPSLLTVLLSMAALAGLLTVFTRALLRGLASLQASMARVREGDLSVTVSSEARDEIGMLTETFGTMLETIHSLIEKTKEDEALLLDLELRSLRAQIDPHFLYNTLSYINWKAMRAGQTEICHVIDQLSTFYRTCLNMGLELTSVDNELANTRAYVDIQQLLHDGGFDVTYDIPEALLSCQMPTLILQPLIENAIRHGVDQMRAGRGVIRIACRRDGDALVFTVQDNGPGLTGERPGSGGYGLRNVHDRIRLHYGEPFGMVIANRPEGGCTVTITIAHTK